MVKKICWRSIWASEQGCRRIYMTEQDSCWCQNISQTRIFMHNNFYNLQTTVWKKGTDPASGTSVCENTLSIPEDNDHWFEPIEKNETQQFLQLRSAEEHLLEADELQQQRSTPGAQFTQTPQKLDSRNLEKMLLIWRVAIFAAFQWAVQNLLRRHESILPCINGWLV